MSHGLTVFLSVSPCPSVLTLIYLFFQSIHTHDLSWKTSPAIVGLSTFPAHQVLMLYPSGNKQTAGSNKGVPVIFFFPSFFLPYQEHQRCLQKL
jgi:hypothetical protein